VSLLNSLTGFRRLKVGHKGGLFDGGNDLSCSAVEENFLSDEGKRFTMLLSDHWWVWKN
jgi:hypothetical protein